MVMEEEEEDEEEGCLVAEDLMGESNLLDEEVLGDVDHHLAVRGGVRDHVPIRSKL